MSIALFSLWGFCHAGAKKRRHRQVTPSRRNLGMPRGAGCGPSSSDPALSLPHPCTQTSQDGQRRSTTPHCDGKAAPTPHPQTGGEARGPAGLAGVSPVHA